MHESCRRNKYQRTNILLSTDAYTNHKGSCNLEQSLNKNWLNGFHSIYHHHPPISTQSQTTGVVKVSCTRNKYHRTNSLLSTDAYTNHRGSCILEQSLNNNWLNGLHSIYSHNTPQSFQIHRKSIKSDIIPRQYSVIQAVLVKFDVLNLSTHQLQRIIPPRGSGVVPKLKMVRTKDRSLMDQYQQVHQIWDHSLPALSDGSSCSEVWYTQPLQIPIAKNNTTKPLRCSS